MPRFSANAFARMSDVAKLGRTVLVVSHQMEAIQTLCSRSVWLDQGRINGAGNTGDVVRDYLKFALSAADETQLAQRTDRRGDGSFRFAGLSLLDDSGTPVPYIMTGKDVRLRLAYTGSGIDLRNVEITIWFRDQLGKAIACLYTRMKGSTFTALPPEGFVECKVPRFNLAPGFYRIDLNSAVQGRRSDKIFDAATVQVIAGDFFGTGHSVEQLGVVLMDHDWGSGTTQGMNAPRVSEPTGT